MNYIEVAPNDEHEYTVTIPLEKYTDLVLAQRELDTLIDFIFNTADYNSIDDRLIIDFVDLEKYLKNFWSYNYNLKINELRDKK